ncbi:hypothetical protein G419_16780 [Rhodococcus triatomae BKS 15-14]|nr:hypothetical protein G419_16780 [Rhodococcus triatomae BKS 15-14]
MVDNKYYGRGDKTNTPLSHEGVLRYHQRLLSDRADLKTDVATLLDDIDSAASLIGLIAEPIGLRDELLTELTEDHNWENHVSTILGQADTRAIGPHLPPYTRAGGYQRRAEGVAVTDGMPNETRQFNGDGKAAELVFHESGRLTLVSEKATYQHTRAVVPPPPATKVIFEELIVAKTEMLVHVAAEVAKWAGYQGSWRFALTVRGLKGGEASLFHEALRHSSGPQYTADTYTRETEATFLDIDSDPNAVVRPLVMPLLRSLNVHTHAQFGWLRTDPA